jgi:hypothetical protein
MEEQVVTVERDLGVAVDFDVGRDGAWVGVFQRNTGLFVASSHGTDFALGPAVRFPAVRFVGANRLIVVSQRSSKDPGESFIAELDGTQRAPIAAGDGIEDIVVLRDLIAVTYFDEGVFSGVPPSEQGIAFFDCEGRLFGGYRSIFGSDAVDIVDCYAACRVDDHTIGFSAYLGFDLVLANPRARIHQAQRLPRALHGSSAISLKRETALLFSPYDGKGAILEYAGGAYREIDRRSGPLRGLEYGRFLSNGEHGFTILSADPD